MEIMSSWQNLLKRPWLRLEKRLVRISGRKKVVGKPFLYRTTREFLMHFGLESLEDLPPLEEFEEIFGAEGGESVGEVAGEEPIPASEPAAQSVPSESETR